MKKIKIFLLFVSVAATFNIHAQIKNVKHIILIGVDGLGAYAFSKADTSTMKQ